MRGEGSPEVRATDVDFNVALGYGPNLRAVSLTPAGMCIPVTGDAVSVSLFWRIIMKSGRTLINLAQELERQLASKQDMLIPSSLMHCLTDDFGSCNMLIRKGDGAATYGVTSLARRQLAEKLKIPFAYFERMRTEQPVLLDRNVNTWLETDNERRMIRILDGNIRAVLSDRYRRLDNYDLAENVLPILQSLPGARFKSVELTDTKMYIKVVTPGTRFVVAPGDVVQAGVVISNSEVGQGTLTVQPLVYRMVCSNGLIVPDRGLRKTHVGRTLQSEEEAFTLFRDDTLAADDKAFFLKVRDVVEAAVSEATFLQVAQKMQKTLDIKLTGDLVKSIEVLANRYTLNEVERAGVLRHLITAGELSAYGLVNAVTHYSQDVADYDRATEFEAMGGKLIELGASEWKELVQAA